MSRPQRCGTCDCDHETESFETRVPHLPNLRVIWCGECVRVKAGLWTKPPEQAPKKEKPMNNGNTKHTRQERIAWLAKHRDLWERHVPPSQYGKERSEWMRKYGAPIVASMQIDGLVSLKTNVYDVNLPRMIFEIIEQG